MRTVEIEKVLEPEQLIMQRWRFWFDEQHHCLVLDAYIVLGRQTRRHGWKVQQEYQRIARRGGLPEPERVDPGIAAEALRLFMTDLRVVTDRARRR